MQITYGQLFKFMGTFSNQDLNDAQTIAKHTHQALSKSYNQALVDILIAMRMHQDQETYDPMPELTWPQLYSWSVKAGDQVQTLVQLLPSAEIGTAQ